MRPKEFVCIEFCQIQSKEKAFILVGPKSDAQSNNYG